MTTNTQPSVVRVSKMTLRGKPLDGRFPVVRLEDQSVVIQHPEFGKVRVPRANTDVPASAGVTLSYDELLAEIKSRFDTLNRLMEGIVAGKVRSLIVSGAPGVGKTFSIETRLLAARSDKRVRRFKVVRGTVSPIGLYKLMWEHRRAGEIIVLDDSDSIFTDEIGLSLIKAATDSSKRRTVSYHKEAHSLVNEGIPQDFDYEGSMVVATNIDFEREIAAKSKLAAHLSAVLNRSLYLDLGLHSKQALLARVEDVCRNTPMLRDEGLSAEQIDMAVLWLKENQATVRSMSLRTAMSLAGLIVTDPTHWRKTAKTTLLRAVSR